MAEPLPAEALPEPPVVTSEPPRYDRELSWVAFNGRVLQEAADPGVPLNERINFLAIFSSNLDEFFRVRVAALRALLRLRRKKRKKLDFDPAATLDELHRRVTAQQERFGAVFREEVLPALARHGLHLREHRGLPPEHAAWLDGYFRDRVAALLHPVVLGEAHVGDPLAPFLENGRLYLAVELWPRGVELRSGEPTTALVEIPSPPLGRFVELPPEGAPEEERVHSERTVLFLDDVVRHGLPLLFPGHEVGPSWAVKLTRDADLQVDDEFSGDLVAKIRKGLERRSQGVPSRFLYDARMPHYLLLRLQQGLELEDEDLVVGGRYHNLSDLWTLPRPGDPGLSYPPFPPLPHPELAGVPSLFEAIRAQDYLLHFPYQRYDPVVRLFEEAAADPAVEEVWVTLYRIARDSAVVRQLIAAAEAGKRVEVFVEVKARFDEENNLTWAGRMEEAGVRVHYSMPGLKVHAKAALFARREGDGSDGSSLRHYAYLGTGNFNEKTARIYADHGLMTADPRLTADARRVFAFLTGEDEHPRFEHLLVAPFALREGVYALIERERAHARAGRRGALYAKMNGLEDDDMIEKLCEAAQAGVDVRLMVRGLCRLVPGVEGVSEGIRARSIVDRFLEHARAWLFHDGGDERLYLASADWMKRNLSHRVEVAFPIYDAALREELKAILDLQWADDTKARVLDAEQSNAYWRPPEPRGVRAQFDTYRLLAERVEKAP
jgi:polyphosphate kinase